MELKQNIYIEGRQDLDVLVLISKLYRSSCVSTIRLFFCCLVEKGALSYYFAF